MSAKPIKILIQRADRLGDMIFTLPVIEEVKKRYPHVSIHILTSKLNKDLIESHPLVDKCIIVNLGEKKWLTTFRDLIANVKKENYSIYISLWNNPWMAWLGKLAGIPIRIGDSSQFLLKYLFNKTVYQRWNDITRHQIQFNLDLLAPLFIKSSMGIRKIYVDNDASIYVQEKIQKYLDPNRKHILIMVSTGGSNYPLSEKTIRLFIDQVLSTKKFNVILAGNVEANSGLISLKEDYVLNEISQTSFKQLTAFINEVDFYIGGDTGPTHIASFLNKPIVFYSPRKGQLPTSWGPLSSFFKIIRNDYINADNVPETSGPQLYDTFCQLVQDISLNSPFTKKTRHDYLMTHSIRVLYCFSTHNEYLNAISAIRSLRKKGILIITCTVPKSFFLSIRQILYLVKKHNINVIQSKYIPTFFTFLIRFIMGTFYQYRMPVSIEQPIHDYIEKDDCFRFYRNAYKTIS